ncbi:unnamed protein product [Sphagnum balticum]
MGEAVIAQGDLVNRIDENLLIGKVNVLQGRQVLKQRLEREEGETEEFGCEGRINKVISGIFEPADGGGEICGDEGDLIILDEGDHVGDILLVANFHVLGLLVDKGLIFAGDWLEVDGSSLGGKAN